MGKDRYGKFDNIKFQKQLSETIFIDLYTTVSENTNKH